MPMDNDYSSVKRFVDPPSNDGAGVRRLVHSYSLLSLNLV